MAPISDSNSNPEQGGQSSNDAASSLAEMLKEMKELSKYLERTHISRPIGIPKNAGLNTRLKSLLASLPQLIIEQSPIPTHPRLEKFELFEKLPKEIRFEIWGILSNQPRMIKLLEGAASQAEKKTFFHPWDSNVTDQSRHPAVVHICKESRQEGLRYYQICHDRPRIYLTISNSEMMGGELRMRLVNDDRGKSNTFFINFKVDKFVHGATKFHLKNRQLAGENDFNFESDILRQVQQIVQRPCYEDALSGFRAIYNSTHITTIGFRHKIWEGLRYLAVVVDEYDMKVMQDCFIWELWRHDIEVKAENFIRTFGTTSLLSSRTKSYTQNLVPMKFKLRFLWKCHPRNLDSDYSPSSAVVQLCSSATHPELFKPFEDANKKILKKCFELYQSRGD